MPNNAACPLLLYPQVLAADSADQASAFEHLFGSHGWRDSWRNGVFPYHHFHSTAHEVLGIFSGAVEVQFGGEGGVCLTARRGDVVVVPAGVAHKKLSSRGTLGVVGAYPVGQSPDLCVVGETDYQRAAHNVSEVPLPRRDPVFGAGGPLFEHWS